MNKRAGNGIRVARENRGISLQVFANQMAIPAETLREYENGLATIPAAHLHCAEILLNNGYAYYFDPYCRPELFGNPTENVIRFPDLATIAGDVE